MFMSFQKHIQYFCQWMQEYLDWYLGLLYFNRHVCMVDCLNIQLTDLYCFEPIHTWVSITVAIYQPIHHILSLHTMQLLLVWLSSLSPGKQTLMSILLNVYIQYTGQQRFGFHQDRCNHAILKWNVVTWSLDWDILIAAAAASHNNKHTSPALYDIASITNYFIENSLFIFTKPVRLLGQLCQLL